MASVWQVVFARGAGKGFHLSPGLWLLVAVLWISSAAGTTLQGSLTVTWDMEPGGDVAGYHVYYGTATGVYTAMVTVGNTNRALIEGLNFNSTYYITVTAFGSPSGESEPSAEVVSTVPMPVEIQLTASPPGQFGLRGTGPAGHSYDVLATQDFMHWHAIGAVTASADGTLAYTDSAARNYAYRFYCLNDTTYVAPGSLPVFQHVLWPDGQVTLQIAGLPGHTYAIYAMEDLSSWIVIGIVTLELNGTASFIDSYLPVSPSRVYMLTEF